jgi:hypothetical protein
VRPCVTVCTCVCERVCTRVFGRRRIYLPDAVGAIRCTLHMYTHLVNVHVNELRLGFSNTTRNPEGILSHNLTSAMPHMAEKTCCSPAAVERPMNIHLHYRHHTPPPQVPLMAALPSMLELLSSVAGRGQTVAELGIGVVLNLTSVEPNKVICDSHKSTRVHC